MLYVIKLKRKMPDCDSYLVWTMSGLGFTETPYVEKATRWSRDELKDSVLKNAKKCWITWKDYEIVEVKE